MKKLKIALVSLTISPDSQDGSAKFFSGIYDYLKSRGHDVKVITGKWNINLRDPNISQIKIIRQSYLWIPQFALKAINFLRNADYDIIHGNGPKGTLPIILSGKERFISTIHDLGPFETPFTKIPLEKFLIKYVAKKATYITTCSDFIRKEFKYSQ